MKPEYFYAFYEYVLLPQFDIKEEVVGWWRSVKIGPDEMAHYFSTTTHDFILIFEDYDGLGRDSEYIAETLGLANQAYTFVTPKTPSASAPSLQLVPPAPFKYAPYITGTFTLLKLHQQLRKESDKIVQLHIKNNSGWVQTLG